MLSETCITHVPHLYACSSIPSVATTADFDCEPTGLEISAGRLALRCLARGRGEPEWRGRTVSRALERRPAKVSLSAARDMQGEVVARADEEEDRSGGGVEGFFGQGARGEGVWEKE